MTASPIVYFILCLLAYLLGSIPFGVIVGKLKGIDLRKEGSGNIGAANAIRSLGFFWGFLVLLGDMLKSFFALIISKQVFGCEGVVPGSQTAAVGFVGIGMCAILGHNFSCFLRFRGGKGVATTLGVFLFLSWKATFAAFAFWAAVVGISGYASLGSLVSACMLPVFMKLFRESPVYFYFSLVAFMSIVIKHRKNIQRIGRGEEKKLVFKPLKKEQM